MPRTKYRGLPWLSAVLVGMCIVLGGIQARAVVEASQAPNPVPYVNQSPAPAAIPPGSADFTVTVTGTGFVPGSEVNWNGQPRATTFVNSSQLTAQIAAADVATASTASISVFSPAPGGGTSNTVLFQITTAFSPVSMSQTDVTAGANPASIAIGDFNGDGRPDLAAANDNPSGSITVLLANGDGTFQSSIIYAGSSPASMLATDLNGDGKLDLAIANAGSGTISVLLGNGDGTFQPPVSYAAGANPSSIVAGDFDANGNLDLAVANSGSGTISILLGNGDGTFADHTDFPTGANPRALALGDFNHDGHLDLAAANSDNAVSILLGAGDGSFPTDAEYAVGSAPSSVITADFDGNGILDLAVANANSNNVSVLLGNGDGTFQAHVDYAVGTSPAAILAGDFDGDGKLDLAVANTGSNSVSMLLGNGNGTFQSGANFTSGADPVSMAAADFNNDGRLDLAVAGQSSGMVSLLIQSPAVSLSAPSLSFGDQTSGTTSAAQTVAVRNTGSAALIITSIATGGANAGDFVESDNCVAASPLPPNGTCTIGASFHPSTTTDENAVLTISNNAGAQTISLSGTGTAASTNNSSSTGNTNQSNQALLGNQASFLGFDTTTQGNWRGVYGGDGYSVASDFQSIPLYASFAVQNGLNYVWDPYPGETRDLQRASTSGRIAATWYSTQTFAFDVNLTDGNAHPFALYALDWDSMGRSETIQISDATSGTVLDTKTISNFANGVYVIWNLSGRVKISVTSISGPNGVISGAFFGGAGSNVSSNVIISPPVSSLAAGDTQQFTVVVQNSTDQSVTWSVSPSVGTISATGLYTAPALVTSAQTLTVSATSSAGVGSATLDLTPGSAATFVTSDASTQGNWKGMYGVDGYSVAGDSQSIPGYASFAVQNQVNYTWASSTSDSRALQTSDGAGRIAGTWYNPQSYTFDVHLTDRAFHSVALYALDWDGLGRSEMIQILDASTGTVLDSRTISNFGNGVYLVWNLYGHVTIKITSTSEKNAAISGVFFGGGSSTGTGANPQGSGATPSGTVSFVALDSTTQGNWQGSYGTEGYFVANDSESIPSNVSLGIQNQFNYVWDASASETRDLEKASGPGRIAATWYNPQTFNFDLNFADANSHTFAVYALDWDGLGRTETVQILDANTNAVLDSRSIANFTNGVYLVWTLSGHVRISVSATGGSNAVIGAVFFGGPGGSASGDTSSPVNAAVSFIASDAATQGTWRGVYGTDGYSVANDSQLIPPYATLAVQNQLNYTWAATSKDSRALQTGSGSGRLATAWYSVHDAIPPTFDFDVNFIDGNSHQFALYAVDWDSQGRAETVQIVDAATNAVLDTRQISNFTNGIYLVWTISGHVKVKVTETVGPNCVVSGVFFGGIPGLINVTVSPQSVNVPVGQTQQFSATVTGTTNQNVIWSISPNVGTISATGLYTAPSLLTSTQPIAVTATSEENGTRFGTATINLTAAAVNFVANDTTTQGNWHGVYGADGYSIANDSQSLPTYASFAVQNPNGAWTWDGNPADPRALQKGNGTGRIAAAWYKNHDSFYFDVNFTDGQTHQLAIYAMDWDSTQRSETVQVLDATTNALLDSRIISNCNGGVYLVWNVSGHVTININVASGANAVVSGVFFK